MASADSLEHFCCWRHADAIPRVQVKRTRLRITLNASMCPTYGTQALELWNYCFLAAFVFESGFPFRTTSQPLPANLW